MSKINIVPLQVQVDLKSPISANLEEMFPLQYTILNCKTEPVLLRYDLENSGDFFVTGFSKRKIELGAEERLTIEVSAIPLKAGLLKLPILKVTDIDSKTAISNPVNQNTIKINF